MNTAYEMSSAVTRKVDGALLIFQRYEGVWMIDRVSTPANERGDEDFVDVPDDLLAHDALMSDDGTCESPGFDGCTAVAGDELEGLTEPERRRFHARQLRRLGLPERGLGASVLWAMISDFHGFRP